jgi:hypothetical protein
LTPGLNCSKLTPGYSEGTINSLRIVDEEVVNNDLIEALIVAILDPINEYPPGGILVFVSGLMEITNLLEQLAGNRQVRETGSERQSRKRGKRGQSEARPRPAAQELPPDRILCLPLHSTLSTQEQQRVFQRVPAGVRKVVISTNIAETSVTIDDIVFVIDTGRHKENRFDPVNRMPQLMECWVSRANARQRRGRAGRVRPGNAFFLYTRERSEKLAEYQTPEMHRVPLDELCLQIKLLGLGDVAAFLQQACQCFEIGLKGFENEISILQAIEPPNETAVLEAIKGLQELQALDLRQYLTPLGYHLASLPVNVRVGKMMLFGSIFRCLDPVLTIAAGLASRSPFVSPFDKREEADKAHRAFAVPRSDHLTILKAFDGWQNAEKRNAGRQYCTTHYLSSSTLRMIQQSKKQYIELLLEIGFLQAKHLAGALGGKGGGKGKGGGRGRVVLGPVGGTWYNANAEQVAVIKAVICAGLYPNLVKVEPPPPMLRHDGTRRQKRPPRLRNRQDGEVFVHPISVNFDASVTFPSPYLLYFEKVKTTKVYIRDATMMTPYPLLLFGGELEVKHEQMVIQMDEWVEFASMGKVAVLIKQLRHELDRLLVEKIEQVFGIPSYSLSCPSHASCTATGCDKDGALSCRGGAAHDGVRRPAEREDAGDHRPAPRERGRELRAQVAGLAQCTFGAWAPDGLYF